MADEVIAAVSVERLLGGELAAAAEETLVSVQLGAFDPALVTRFVTAHELLELYGDLRHHRLTASAVDDSLVAVRHRYGVNRGSQGEPIHPDRQPVEASFDGSGPALAVRLATAQVLLALHWELCHQHPGPTPAGNDASLEWVSALLCTPAILDYGPDDFAVSSMRGTPGPRPAGPPIG